MQGQFVVGPEPNRIGIGACGRLQIALVLEHHTEVVSHLSILGGQRLVAAIGLNRLGGVMQLEMALAQPRPSLRQVSIEVHGVAILHTCLLQAALQPQQVAQGQMEGAGGG